jgi:hypothetical protein
MAYNKQSAGRHGTTAAATIQHADGPPQSNKIPRASCQMHMMGPTLPNQVKQITTVTGQMFAKWVKRK